MLKSDIQAIVFLESSSVPRGPWPALLLGWMNPLFSPLARLKE